MSTSAPAAPTTSREDRVWPEEGPLKWAVRATEPAITANDLRTRLYQLADDSMMGRRIGELGNFKGTTYVASEFARLGLKAGGDNGTYFQILDYGPVVFDSTKSRLIVAGSTLQPKADWIPSAPSFNNGIVGLANWQNVPTVFAGRWGDTLTVLDGNAIRGKVAVFTAPPAGPGGRGGRGGGAFTAVHDPRAQSAGAAGVLVAALDSMPRNVVNVAFNSRNTMRPAVNANGIGAAAISSAAAAQIFGRSLDQVGIGTTGQPVSGRWSYDWKLAQHPARNVIAILPGSDPARATQYMLVGAHNDHVGTNATGVDHDSLRAFNRVMRPQGANDPVRQPNADEQQRINELIANARRIRAPRRDSIMNGADDDGSGTVVLLEIAEKFATEKPARSIIFISHQGEEAGLLGSRWFVDHPTVTLDSIVAAHNMDMVGKGRVTDVKYGGPNSVQTLGARRLSRQFGEIIDSVNALSPEPMAIDRSWDVPANPLNRFCRSDQVNYVNSNIPVTYFSLGYSIDYHQATDEPQYVDYDHSARLGRWIHEIMTAIANRRDRPAIAGQDPAYPSCR
jgi:Peptidase family M28